MSQAATPIAKDAFLELHADMSLAARSRLAMADLAEGLRLWQLAWKLGWLDIRLRYRGSALGPFWLTLSTGIMVGALGLLYSTLFHINLHDYLPFLSLSLVLWGFLSTLVSESCTAFTDTEAIIRAVRMPFFVFAIRTVIRNLLVLAHNLVVIVAVFILLSWWPGWAALIIVVPSLVVWVVDALALALLLGAFCARFRDIQPIVNSVMQIGFFVTPVIWKPAQLGTGVRFLPLSPFYDVLEIVRSPMLGSVPDATTWLGAICYSLLLCGIAWAFFVRARGRIAFWL